MTEDKPILTSSTEEGDAEDQGFPRRLEQKQKRLFGGILAFLVLLIIADIVIAFVYKGTDFGSEGSLEGRATTAAALVMATLFSALLSNLLLCVGCRFCADLSCRCFDSPLLIGIHIVACILTVLATVTMPLVAGILLSVNLTSGAARNLILAGFGAGLSFAACLASVALYVLLSRSIYVGETDS
eukprot:m.8074 g.8074  ORF g.8074 m.8074 type:complete len:185 (+) comp20309_c0_seq1:62-616(+)